MASLNRVMLIGNLGRDPEIRYAPNGDAIANFSIATTEKYKDKEGNPVENTEWHKIVMHGKVAEICGQYLKKGSQVYLEGKIATRRYTAKDGTEKTVVEIKCDQMKMLGGRGSDQAGQASAPRSEPQQPRERPAPAAQAQRMIEDDDIPF